MLQFDQYSCLGAILNIRVGILEPCTQDLFRYFITSYHFLPIVFTLNICCSQGSTGLYLFLDQHIKWDPDNLTLSLYNVNDMRLFSNMYACVFFNLWQMKCINKCTPYYCYIKSVTLIGELGEWMIKNTARGRELWLIIPYKLPWGRELWLIMSCDSMG